MQSQCVQYVIAGHILILITDHIEVTSPGSFKMWTIFNRWAHCNYFVSVNTMSSQCTCWVFDPLPPVRGGEEVSIANHFMAFQSACPICSCSSFRGIVST